MGRELLGYFTLNQIKLFLCVQELSYIVLCVLKVLLSFLLWAQWFLKGFVYVQLHQKLLNK